MRSAAASLGLGPCCVLDKQPQLATCLSGCAQGGARRGLATTRHTCLTATCLPHFPQAQTRSTKREGKGPKGMEGGTNEGASAWFEPVQCNVMRSMLASILCEDDWRSTWPQWLCVLMHSTRQVPYQPNQRGNMQKEPWENNEEGAHE